jgi:regulation of enolase protein 1 (concanavalin A-like superfamily)
VPFPTPRLAIRLFRIATLAAGVLLSALTVAAQPGPPFDWLEADIGGGTGRWAFNDDGFIVDGSGTDIWGTADSFHFVYQQLNGDGEFRAHVLGVTGVEDWTKAGLMIRQSLDPGSPHHFLLASKAKRHAYQRRLTPGAASLNTPLAAPNDGAWLRMVRTGATVALDTSDDGVNWRRFTTVNWPVGPTYIGFAVTSHSASAQPTGTGRFESVALTGDARSAPFVKVTAPEAGDAVQGNVPYTIRWDATSTDGDPLERFSAYFGVEQGGAIVYSPIAGCTNLPETARSCVWDQPGPITDAAHILVTALDAFSDQGRDDSGRFSIEVPQPGTLPAGWSSNDIGAVSAVGSASGDGSNFTVRGSGSDIWSTTDNFQFAHKTMSGDFSITARVVSIENVNAWTKAGLMAREGLGQNVTHGFLLATPTTVKGVAFQYRPSENAASGNVSGPKFAPPVWLKLVRRGPTLSSYYRHSITDPWTFLNYQVYDSLADSLEVGFAVSSHVDGRLATAQFTDVIVEPLTHWQIGGVASQGTASTDETIFGLFGKGSDVWGTADSFMYGFIPWVGNGTMTARVRSLENSSPWAKAGVMFRESTTPGSKHVFAMVTPGHGAAVQYRLTTGGQSASGGGTTGAAPAWVRLTRIGDSFIGEVSTDGVTWTSIGSATVQMGQTVYVGIVHTSHNSADAGGARFDDLRMTR